MELHDLNKELNMSEFYGTMKITPKYAKCDPLFVKGHWIKKNIGKPYRVWSDENLYKNGVNETICEIAYIERANNNRPSYK